MSKVKSEASLFISYRFPPDGGVGCLRNHEAAVHNAAYRKSVILTPAIGLYDTKNLSDEDDLDIRLIQNTDIKSKVLSAWRNKLSGSVMQPLLRKISSWMEMKSNLSSSISVGGLGYTDRCFEEYQLVSRDYDLRYLYSSYQPLQDLEIAALIKSKTPEIYWICDFRDYPRSYSELSENHKRRLLNICSTVDYLLFSTEGLSDYYQFLSSSRRTVLYSGSLHHKTPVANKSSLKKNSDKFVICYAGSLYGPRALGFFLR